MNASLGQSSQALASGRPGGVSERVDRNLIRTVVGSFYRAARQDPDIGPVFAQHVEDWDGHLETMTRFWASVLLGERSYFGNPFGKHSALPELSAEHFRKWLEIFSRTLGEHCSAADAVAWETTARRMGFAMSSRLGFDRIDDLLP